MLLEKRAYYITSSPRALASVMCSCISINCVFSNDIFKAVVSFLRPEMGHKGTKLSH
jgi:hypothetical protein